MATAVLAGVAGLAGAFVGLLVAPLAIKWAGHRPRFFRLGCLAGVGVLSCGLVAFLFTLLIAPDGMARREDPATDIPEGDKPPNVVLIVLDSLRQDAIEGDRAGKIAPNVIKFGSEANAYTACQAVCSWTRPSMAGMLTGRYPATLGVHTGNLPDHVTTLAERLLHVGYETVGLSDNYLISPAFGFAQGHEYYWQKNVNIMINDLLLKRRIPNRYFQRMGRQLKLLYQGAPTINKGVRAWTQKRDPHRPFYLMVHYMDIHYPFYVYSDEPDNLSNQSTPETFVPYYEMLNLVEKSPKPPFANLTLPAEKIEDFQNRYNGGVQYADRHVGELFNLIKNMGEWDNTLVIVTADHGEEFFEHGCFSHGRSLYQESIRVPLMIKWPRQLAAEGKTITQPVSSLQIMPTVLAVTGTKIEESSDLLPGLSPSDEPADPIVFSEFERSGVTISVGVRGQFKRIHSRTEAGRELSELYDTLNDPEEKTNLWETHASIPDIEEPFEKFRQDLDQQKPDHQKGLSQDQIEKLKSLGYAE